MARASGRDQSMNLKFGRRPKNLITELKDPNVGKYETPLYQVGGVKIFIKLKVYWAKYIFSFLTICKLHKNTSFLAKVPQIP